METATDIFVFGIIIICIFPIISLVQGKNEFIDFSVLFSLTILGWFLPQLIAEMNSDLLPQEALFKASLMAFLCFSATILGYYFYKPKIKLTSPTGNIEKLKDLLLFFGIVLLIPFIFLRNIPDEELQGGWSGRPVMLQFFYLGLKYTSLYAFLLWLGGDKSKKTLLIIGSGIFYYLFTIVGGGRKAEALEVFFAITGGLYFMKTIRIPRTAFLISAFLFAIFTPSTGEYRNIVMSNETHKVEHLIEINWIENFKNTFTTTGGEVQNYIMGLYTIDQEGTFDYGLFHWNSLVSRFIPQQILGGQIKNSLMAPISKPAQEAAKYGHEYATGQTTTGLLDAFSSFWYFGFLKFLAIGIAFKYLYLNAKNGLLKDKMIYIFLITSGLHSVTHSTDWFVFAYIHLWIFTFPYQKYAKIIWPPKPIAS